MSVDQRQLADLPDVLVPRQVAEYLGFRGRPDRVVREILEPAGLKVLVIGRRLRILRRDLEAFIHAQDKKET